MDLGLAGKVAMVAGGSKGLGRAVAMRLAMEGASVAICARGRAGLDEARDLIKSETGREVLALSVDLSDTDQATGFARKVIDHFGTVDILVNNAGGPPVGDFMDITDEQWEAGFRLNLMSAISLTRQVIPVMRSKRWGRIANITSVAVKQPLAGLIVSNAIRAGITGWAKTLSNELAPDGITVNNILPGFTLTDRLDQLSKAMAEREGTTPDEVFRRWTSQIPTGRLGTPEEFADVVAFVVSERAGYVTGASVQVDGGIYKGIM